MWQDDTAMLEDIGAADGRPLLTVGDAVCVRPGTPDPDFPGRRLDGWSGSIIEQNNTVSPAQYLVQWDKNTVSRITFRLPRPVPNGRLRTRPDVAVGRRFGRPAGVPRHSRGVVWNFFCHAQRGRNIHDQHLFQNQERWFIVPDPRGRSHRLTAPSGGTISTSPTPRKIRSCRLLAKHEEARPTSLRPHEEFVGQGRP